MLIKDNLLQEIEDMADDRKKDSYNSCSIFIYNIPFFVIFITVLCRVSAHIGILQRDLNFGSKKPDLKVPLKRSFTYKQHAWEPPSNRGWKIDLWPLKTEILKINTSFAEKTPEKVEIITRTPAEMRPSDFSLRFLT